MSDNIYLYPKSSCNVEKCYNSYPIPNGYKSNLSVLGCHASEYFDCYNRVELNKQIQPLEENNEIYDLNKQAYTDKLSESFDAVKCPCGPVAPSCPEIVYLSRDPRQFDSARADYIPLDSIPIDGNVRLKDIYDEKYEKYGAGFTPYTHIKDGQIVYYIDKSIQAPFYKPVYSEPAEQVSNLFKDPMGAMKPEYNRNSLINLQNPTTIDRKDYLYKLSFLQDTNGFREDLLALQQRKNNEQKWSARWGDVKY